MPSIAASSAAPSSVAASHAPSVDAAAASGTSSRLARRVGAVLAVAACLAAAGVAQAQSATPGEGTRTAEGRREQPVEPEVARRDVRVPKIPSNDFSIGLLAGTYASENFGSNGVVGLRVGYHITEDFFVEGVYGQTKISDAAFRQVLPGGVFSEQSQKLTYYNVSLGWNLLPGEFFVGRNRAFPASLYVIGGLGSTKLAEQSRQTISFGVGARLHLSRRWALQVDMRDHLFSLDLLGKRQSTQNLELTAGLGFFF